jgi:predicted metal-dependent HD superfamily phosphohydrolase
MTSLRTSWHRAWRDLGAHDDGETLRVGLLARYSEPHRKYHSLQHLTEVLQLFDSVRHLAAHPAEVEVALWFHDAIYEVQKHDNEERSAQWARAAALAAGIQQETADRLYTLVMATRHTSVPAEPDEQLLVDIDLSILGADSERFDQYERQIRDEYAFVPLELFKQKRRAILQTFLARPRIFSAPHLAQRFEEAARANLLRAETALR